ncbi:MAG TPA: alpha/beta hydrolase [Oceanipulchritudo sp.]|nr:alpha/beta hydrolase [Oceanipulchritudo sp.]
MNSKLPILCAVMCLMNSVKANETSVPGEADPVKAEWIQLLPKDNGDTEQETYTDGHVRNVRSASLGVFRSSIGDGPRPAFVICPGGGYNNLTIIKEGYVVAEYFNKLGIDGYVLKYRMKEFGYPAPLIDVTRAIRYLRAHAGELGIDPDRIGVLGFSAGGHVAGMATTLYDSPDARAGDELDNISARPDFSVLVYPVLTMLDPHAHAGSRRGLLGIDPTEEMRLALSLENRVTEDTPPVFLMHTAEDGSVPVENSLHFAESMARHGLKFALHVYPSGPHGIGMRPGFGSASGWPDQLAIWLRENGLVSTAATSSSPE